MDAVTGSDSSEEEASMQKKKKKRKRSEEGATKAISAKNKVSLSFATAEVLCQ